MTELLSNEQKVFSRTEPTINENNVKTSEFEAQTINTNIISFKMNDEDTFNLKEEPIELIFSHLSNQFNSNPTCAYWSYNNTTFEGVWLNDGCNVKSSNDTHTVCRCNHLTHFAVLMDVYGVFEKPISIHSHILTILTTIFSTISVVCLIFTLLAFRHIKTIKRSRENSSTTKDLTRITTHLCVCLILALVVFLFGNLVQALRFKTTCSIIAIISHYLFLSSFLWMLLEGVQLYLMLIRVFSLERSPMTMFCFIAYGLPSVIVILSVVINFFKLEGKGYGTLNHCWLSSYRNFNLSFIVPITFILIFNFTILLTVVYKMRNTVAKRKAQINKNKKQEEFYKSLLGFWGLIITLLGLPWIIGYFIFDSQKSLVFSYLFTILNSSQGTIIFIFNCIVSKNVRDELITLLLTQKHRLFNNSSNTSTSSKQSINKSSQNSKLIHTSSNSSSFKTKKNVNLNKNLSNSSKNSRTTKKTEISFFQYFYEIFFCKRSKQVKITNTNNSASIKPKNISNTLPHATLSSNTAVSSEENSSTNLLLYENNALSNVQNLKLIKISNVQTMPHRVNEQNNEFTHLWRNNNNHLNTAPRLHISSVNSRATNNTINTYMSPISSYSMSSATPPPSYNGYYMTPRSSNNYNEFEQTPITLVSFKPQNYENHNLLGNENLNIEEHNYSLIEEQNDSQYYCDDNVFESINEEEYDSNCYSEMNNPYAEVEEDKISNVNSNSTVIENSQLRETNEIERKKRSLFSFKSKTARFHLKKKQKLNDLITMPEEYDYEASIGNSNISDQDLFNMTSPTKTSVHSDISISEVK